VVTYEGAQIKRYLFREAIMEGCSHRMVIEKDNSFTNGMKIEKERWQKRKVTMRALELQLPKTMYA
jgi:hypothetical protein